jgi:hypothetical protein
MSWELELVQTLKWVECASANTHTHIHTCMHAYIRANTCHDVHVNLTLSLKIESRPCAKGAYLIKRTFKACVFLQTAVTDGAQN